MSKCFRGILVVNRIMKQVTYDDMADEWPPMQHGVPEIYQQCPMFQAIERVFVDSADGLMEEIRPAVGDDVPDRFREKFGDAGSPAALMADVKASGSREPREEHQSDSLKSGALEIHKEVYQIYDFDEGFKVKDLLNKSNNPDVTGYDRSTVNDYLSNMCEEGLFDKEKDGRENVFYMRKPWFKTT